MMKRTLGGILILVAVGAVLLKSQVRDRYIEWSKPPVPSEQPRQSSTPKPSGAVIATTPPPAATGAINLAVPFSSQAPRGDWSLPWQEACEETSAFLVHSFWNDTKPSVAQVEAAVQALVRWQQEQFGYYKHTTAAQTAQMIREVYGYKRVEVQYDVGTSEIANHIRAGRPVIVPLAGRKLGNPYYTSPGPVYHMMVVKGIAQNGDIITNDVGTSHGYNLTYAPKVFLAAMHDAPTGGDEWPADVDEDAYIDSGRRAIIVVYPN